MLGELLWGVVGGKGDVGVGFSRADCVDCGLNYVVGFCDGAVGFTVNKPPVADGLNVFWSEL